MPLTSPGNDDDTGENHQPTLRKNTAEPVEQTLKQNRWHPAEGAEVRDDVLPQVRPVRVAVEAQRRDGDEKSVKRMRGVRYTVLKNPGKLTDRRSEASGNLRDTDPKGRPYRS